MMGLNEQIKLNNQRAKTKTEDSLKSNYSLWSVESLGSFKGV